MSHHSRIVSLMRRRTGLLLAFLALGWASPTGLRQPAEAIPDQWRGFMPGFEVSAPAAPERPKCGHSPATAAQPAAIVRVREAGQGQVGVGAPEVLSAVTDLRPGSSAFVVGVGSSGSFNEASRD